MNGGVLSFIDRGAGSGVLFVHGFALDARVWEAEIAAIRDRHRAIAIDLPGFGPDARAARPGVSDARAALEVLDQLEVDRVHVVGHSLGGAVAVDFALAFPHRVRTLTLVSALLRGRDPGIAAWSRCKELARAGKLSEAREAWMNDPLFAPAHERPAAAAQLRALVSDYGGAHWTGDTATTFESAEAPRRRSAR
jgi:pimeloyl-ACP methyl ester carboxylesterase